MKKLLFVLSLFTSLSSFAESPGCFVKLEVINWTGDLKSLQDVSSAAHDELRLKGYTVLDQGESFRYQLQLTITQTWRGDLSRGGIGLVKKSYQERVKTIKSQIVSESPSRLGAQDYAPMARTLIDQNLKTCI
jgi:hypothetical protein